MRRLCVGMLFAVVLLVMGTAMPVSAQYVTPPGQGPAGGPTDQGPTGGPTDQGPTNQGGPAGQGDPRFTSHSSSRGGSGSHGSGGVEVLGVKFIRGANGEAFALTGAGISVLVLLGVGLVTAGVVVRRRSHHFGGTAPA